MKLLDKFDASLRIFMRSTIVIAERNGNRKTKIRGDDSFKVIQRCHKPQELARIPYLAMQKRNAQPCSAEHAVPLFLGLVSHTCVLKQKKWVDQTWGLRISCTLLHPFLLNTRKAMASRRLTSSSFA